MSFRNNSCIGAVRCENMSKVGLVKCIDNVTQHGTTRGPTIRRRVAARACRTVSNLHAAGSYLERADELAWLEGRHALE